MRWGYILILGFIFWTIGFVQAQTQYTPSHYRLNQGLNTNIIFKSLSLPNGQLLIATNRGLAVFDGHRFIYNDIINRPTPTIFSHQDQIYFSNIDGLSELEEIRKTPKKRINSIQTDSNPNNDHFENIFIDSRGFIWTTDFENVKYYQPDKQITKSFLIHPGNKNIFPNISIIESRKKEIWVISPKGIWIWDKKKNDVQPLANSEFQSKSYTSAIRLQNEKILLSTSDGILYELDTEKPVFKKLNIIPDDQAVVSMVETESDILLSTRQKVYRYFQNQFQLLFQAERKEINHLNYDEATGIIWLSTENGLIKLQPSNPAFSILKEPMIKGVVKSIAPVGKEIIWILTNENEIWKYQNNSFQKIEDPVRGYSYTLNSSNDLLFLSTQNGIYQETNGKFEKLNLPELEIQSEIIQTFITPQNELWVVFASHPVKRYSWPALIPIKIPFKNKPEFWSDNKWQDIKIDKNKRIWLAGWMPKSFGITYFEPENQKFVDVSDKSINPDKTLFVGDYFTHIGLGKDKSMFFTAYGGWNKTSENGKLIQRVDILNFDIRSTFIRGITEDKMGNVFFATAEGLHIYLKKMDQVFHLSELDGLPSNQLTHSFTQLNSNQIALGTNGGFIKIDLEKALKTQLKNRLEISQILVNEQPKTFEGNYIELSKDERDIVIQFSELSFLPEEKVSFRYKFSDEKTWHPTGNKAELVLNHLQPGNYTVNIQALDNLGNVQSKELKFEILAKPPFTKSYPFYILLFLVFSLMMLLINRYFWKRKQKEINYLRKIKEAEMTTLRSQMNPHFLFNTLNSINSYIVQNKTDDASNYLTTFSKLMRNILENSKKEQISLKNELDTLKLYLELESARLEHSFDYIYKIDEKIDQTSVLVPPLIIQPFAENAIWHGLRNLKEKGILEIIVKKPEEDFLHIYVVDNGIGRVASQKLKKNETQHKSYGIDITIDRIKLLNPENDFSIVDLYDEHENPIGTKVIIQLKLKEND